MRFSQWLAKNEEVVKPPVDTPATKKFKSLLQSKLRSQATQASTGKPTQNPQDIVGDLAAQMINRNDTGTGDAAELAGAMQRSKDTAKPHQPGKMQ